MAAFASFSAAKRKGPSGLRTVTKIKININEPISNQSYNFSNSKYTLMTGDIIDKGLLIISDKLQNLSSSQVRIVVSFIDECISLYHSEK